MWLKLICFSDFVLTKKEILKEKEGKTCGKPGKGLFDHPIHNTIQSEINRRETIGERETEREQHPS